MPEPTTVLDLINRGFGTPSGTTTARPSPGRQTPAPGTNRPRGVLDLIEEGFHPAEEARPVIAPRGPLGETLSALGQGFAQTGAAIGGTMEMIGIPGGQKIRDEWQAISGLEPLQRPTYLQQDDEIRAGDWRWWVRNVGENLPNFLMMYGAGASAGAGAGLLGAGVKAIRAASMAGGFGGSFTLEAGSQYAQTKAEMLTEGYGEEETERVATLEGLVSGTANALIEMIPMERVFSPAAAHQHVLKRIIKQGILEGSTEALQEAVNIWSEKIGHKPDQAWIDQANRILTSGIVGAVMGGGVGGPMGAAEHRRQTGHYTGLADRLQLKEDIYRWKREGLADEEIAARAESRINAIRAHIDEVNQGLAGAAGTTPPVQYAVDEADTGAGAPAGTRPAPPIPALQEIDAREMVDYVLYGEGKFAPPVGAVRQGASRAGGWIRDAFGRRKAAQPGPATQTPTADPTAPPQPGVTTAGGSTTDIGREAIDGARAEAIEKGAARAQGEKLFNTVLGELDAEGQAAMEVARKAEVAARQAEEEAAAEAAARTEAARVEQALVSSAALAAQTPEDAPIVAEVQGLRPGELVREIQKTLGITIVKDATDAYVRQYADQTTGETRTEPANLESWRAALLERKLSDAAAARERDAADRAAAAARQEEEHARKQAKADEATLAFIRQNNIALLRPLTTQQWDFLAPRLESLSPEDRERLQGLIPAAPPQKSATPASSKGEIAPPRPSSQAVTETQAGRDTPETATPAWLLDERPNPDYRPAGPTKEDVRQEFARGLAQQIDAVGSTGRIDTEEGARWIGAGGWISEAMDILGHKTKTPLRTEAGAPAVVTAKRELAAALEKVAEGQPLTERQRGIVAVVFRAAASEEAAAHRIVSAAHWEGQGYEPTEGSLMAAGLVVGDAFVIDDERHVVADVDPDSGAIRTEGPTIRILAPDAILEGVSHYRPADATEEVAFGPAPEKKRLDYEEFSKKYREAFHLMTQYRLDQAGSNVYADELARLADEYPDYLEKLEAEEEGKAAAGAEKRKPFEQEPEAESAPARPKRGPVAGTIAAKPAARQARDILTPAPAVVVDKAPPGGWTEADKVPKKPEAPYKIGDRVVIDGKHGEISEVNSLTMQPIFGGTIGRTTTYTYRVKYDSGRESPVIESQIQREAERPTGEVTPDILIDLFDSGKKEYRAPEDVVDSIQRAKKRAVDFRAAAGRAKLTANRNAKLNQAKEEEDHAARLQTAFDEWAQKYPEAAEKYRPVKKPAGASAAAATIGDLSAYGIDVTKSKTNKGTDVWNVSGNTKAHVDAMKRAGGRWYGPKRVWSFYDGDPTAKLLEALGAKTAATQGVRTLGAQPPAKPAVKPLVDPRDIEKVKALTQQLIDLGDEVTGYQAWITAMESGDSAQLNEWPDVPSTIGALERSVERAARIAAAREGGKSAPAKQTESPQPIGLTVEMLERAWHSGDARGEALTAVKGAIEDLKRGDAEGARLLAAKAQGFTGTDLGFGDAIKKPAPAYGAENKIFTEDRANRAREILRKKLGGIHMGVPLDPEIVQAGIELAGYYVEGGARSFVAYSQKMIADFGAAIRPYLKSFYAAVRNYPGIDPEGMDSEADLAEIHPNVITPKDKQALVQTLKKDDLVYYKRDGKGSIGTGYFVNYKGDAVTIEGGASTFDISRDEIIRVERDGQPLDNIQEVDIIESREGGPGDEKIPGGESPSGTLVGVEGTPGLDAGEPSGAGEATLRHGKIEGISRPESRPGLEEGERAPGEGQEFGRGPGGGERLHPVPAGRTGVPGHPAGTAAGETGSGNLAVGEKPARGSRPSDGSLGVNTRIEESDVLFHPGKVARINANIRAIELSKRLIAENRPATPAEQKTLLQFSGWGAVAQDVFNPDFDEFANYLKDNPDSRISGPEDWHRFDYEDAQKYQEWADKYGRRLHPALGGILSDEEWKAAAASTMNAHYTSRDVIDHGLWGVARRLGFTGGRVLEPAAGIGHILGLMPADYAGRVQLMGVELDRLSGQILSQLYPQADIQVTGFEKAQGIPDNSVDLVISNFPFGNYPINDNAHPAYSGWSIHNYFFARSVDALRPGGVVIAITSRYTMDSTKNGKTRDLLADKADLIGAIRLPNTAFGKNAGTEVTTDIIILRKKTAEPYPERNAWRTNAAVKTVDGKDVSINEYFAQHPEMVLGKHALAGTMYRGKDEYTLLPDEGTPLSEQIDAAVSRLPEGLYDAEYAAAPTEYQRADEGTKPGTFVLKDGKLSYANHDGVLVQPEWADNRKRVVQAAAFISVRDAVGNLIRQMQDPTVDAADIAALQQKLNRHYDQYWQMYGPVNEKASAFLDDDVEFPLVLALENLFTKPVTYVVREGRNKGETRTRNQKTYVKSDIFTKRTLFPFVEPTTAENIEDAVNLSLTYKNHVSPDYIAQLLSKDKAAIQAELIEKGLAFVNPETGLLESRSEYLSGNVREKLRTAEAQGMEKNAAALKAVQPRDLTIDEIYFRLGSEWIPANVINAFMADILGVSGAAAGLSKVKAGEDEVSRWTVTDPERYRTNSPNFTVWGAEGKSGTQLVEDCLNLHRTEIYDYTTDDNGKEKRVKNPAKSLNAQQKQREIQQAFKAYVKEHANHAATVAEVYNREKNNYVVRQYDVPGIDHYPHASHLINLRAHQKAAVSRGLQGSTVFAHAVGTGKTYMYTTLAMELRRTGQARKPMIVVQGSTVNQFAGQAKQLYPAARILCPSKKDRTKSERRALLSRIATNDYDMIIIPHSFFDDLNVNPAREMAFIEEQLEEIKAAILELDGDPEKPRRSDPPTVKQLHAMLARKHARLDALKDSPHGIDTIYFEEMGIDAILVDEAHHYKRGDFSTKMGNVKGLDRGAAAKSFRFLMKARAIQEKTRGKNIYLATGTPVSNTTAELWTLLRYVRPDLLAEFGAGHFDGFASMFGDTTQTLEQTETGEFKNVERFNRYVNGPELIKMWQTAADVILQEDVPGWAEMIPRLKGEGIQSVAIPRTQALADTIEQIRQERAEWDDLTGQEKKELSHVPLLLFNRAKQAAIDLRLVRADAPDDPESKTNRVVKEVFNRWQESRPVLGTQLVFVDTYRGPGGFSLYDDIKKKLVGMGIPEAEIANINENKYGNDAAKESLFDKVNLGQVRVVIGSTSKLGIGVNVQERLVALHHVDAPMRPMDFEQRNGRILRPGNTNQEVEVLAYAVINTLDSVTYDRLQKKQKFINQLLRGKLEGRSFEDPADELQFTFEDLLAVSSGNPNVKKRYALENQIREIAVLEDGYRRKIGQLRQQIAQVESQMDQSRRSLAAAEEDKAAAEKAFPDHTYTYTVAGKTYDDPKEGKKALQAEIEAVEAKVEKEYLRIVADLQRRESNPTNEDRLARTLRKDKDWTIPDGWSQAVQDIKGAVQAQINGKVLDITINARPTAADNAENRVKQAQQLKEHRFVYAYALDPHEAPQTESSRAAGPQAGPRTETMAAQRSLHGGLDGILTSLRHVLKQINERPASLAESIKSQEQNLASMKAEIQKPFEFTDTLRGLEQEYDQVLAELAATQATPVGDEAAGETVPHEENRYLTNAPEGEDNRIQEQAQTFTASDTAVQEIKEARDGQLSPARRRTRRNAFGRNAARPIPGQPPEVVSARTAYIRTGTDHVRNAAAAAQVARYLLDSPQEQAIVIVCDKDDKVLAILKHTTGTKTRSTVDSLGVAGMVLNVKKAARAWFVHNHPGADATKPSAEDGYITAALENLFRGTRVSMAGSVIVTGTRYVDVETRAAFPLDPERENKPIKIPVLERTFARRPGTGTTHVTSMLDFLDYASENLSEGGILLLDHQNSPVGFIPEAFTPIHRDYTAIRGPLQESILAEADKRNASAMLVYAPSRTISSQEIDNLSKFIKASGGGIRLLDVVDQSKSAQSDGRLREVTDGNFYAVAGEDQKPAGAKQKSTLTKPDLHALVQGLVRTVKGITVEHRDGAIWIKTNSGQDVRIEAVEQIAADRIMLTLGYNAEATQGKRIAGQYSAAQGTQPRQISLVRDAAGLWTLAHEFYHFLEDIGAISRADQVVLNRKIDALIRTAPSTYGRLQGRSPAERRAEWVGQTLAGTYDPKTATGKILEKIRGIIDRIVNALGVRTAAGVVRDIREGKVFEGKGLPGTQQYANRFAVTPKNGTANIPPKTTPKAEGGTGKIRVIEKSVNDYAKDPQSLVDEILNIIGEDDDSAIVLRGIYKSELGKKKLSRSSVWDDGEPTNRKMGGTSGILVTGNWEGTPGRVIADDIKRNATKVLKYGDTDYVAIVKGRLLKDEIFNDVGEAVVGSPEVIAYIKKTDLPNPSRPPEVGGRVQYALEEAPASGAARPDTAARSALAASAERVMAEKVSGSVRQIMRQGAASLGARVSPEMRETASRLGQHWREFWRPFSTVRDGDRILARRYEAMGAVARAVRFIEEIHAKLDTWPPETKRDLFWHLNGDIPIEALPEDARETARMLRRRLDVIGEMLVERGILDEGQYEKYKGKYVHYLYAKHVLGDDAPVFLTSSGKLNLTYTKSRNPNLTLQQRKELGLIEDASVAVPVGMGKALTDIAKFDYLASIAENPDWVWQPSIVRVPVGRSLAHPVRGRTRRWRKMGIGKLVEEVKTYDQMMAQHPSPEIAEIRGILRAALDRAEAETQNMPEDFVQLPNARAYGALAGAYVRKPIADDLMPVLDVATDRGNLMNTLIGIERQGMAAFKMGKVALNLPTAARNIISNIIQNNMRGRALVHIPGDIVRACESLKAKDARYEEAFSMGLFHTNWFVSEINDVLDEFRRVEAGRIDQLLIAVKNVAKYYGKIDDINKLAIFIEQRDAGKTVDEAALEAMKWGMDYSLTSRSIKGLRQTIMPFATYQYKIAPLIAESLARRPWVLAKYALIYPLATMLARAFNDLDDDDWEDLEKQLPAYIKKSGSMMILPVKSKNGQWQWVNLEYFFPWGNYLSIFRDMKEADLGETIRDAGISNPFLSMFYSGLSTREDQPPLHAYFGTPIYNELDPAPIKAAKLLEYMVNTWTPSMLTRQGAAGYTFRAFTGQEDRWGRTVTPAQALGRWFGVNIVSVSPEQTRAQVSVRIQDLKRELARVEADPSYDEADRAAFRARLDARMSELAETAPAAVLPITKAKGPDPVYDALRGMAAAGTLRTAPPSRTVEIAGTPTKMSMDQYRRYLDQSSELARRRLGPLVTAAAWGRMSGERKADVVAKIVAHARKAARQRLKAEIVRERRAAEAKKSA